MKKLKSGPKQSRLSSFFVKKNTSFSSPEKLKPVNPEDISGSEIKDEQSNHCSSKGSQKEVACKISSNAPLKKIKSPSKSASVRKTASNEINRTDETARNNRDRCVRKSPKKNVISKASINKLSRSPNKKIKSPTRSYFSVGGKNNETASGGSESISCNTDQLKTELINSGELKNNVSKKVTKIHVENNHRGAVKSLWDLSKTLEGNWLDREIPRKSPRKQPESWSPGESPVKNSSSSLKNHVKISIADSGCRKRLVPLQDSKEGKRFCSENRSDSLASIVEELNSLEAPTVGPKISTPPKAPVDIAIQLPVRSGKKILNSETSESSMRTTEEMQESDSTLFANKDVGGGVVTDGLFEGLDDSFEYPEEEEILSKNGLLDFSKPMRCRVLSSEESLHSNSYNDVKVLEVQSLSDGIKSSISVHFPWNSLQYPDNCVVTLCGEKISDTLDDGYGWAITSSEGCFLVLHSDFLVSGTTVVESLFCQRKVVLKHLLREAPGLGVTNEAMVIGRVVHELLQTALKKRISDLIGLKKILEDLLTCSDRLRELYLSGADYSRIREAAELYLPAVVNFMRNHVSDFNAESEIQNGDWTDGEIVNVRDIEENLWCPSLGLKGRIDATVEVKRNPKRDVKQRNSILSKNCNGAHNVLQVMPLELKTGKVSFSAEHKGQVILYGMMLNSLGIVDNDTSGLLLYLRDGQSRMREIKGSWTEKRDLIMLRNQLVQHIENVNVNASKSVCLSASEVDKVSKLDYDTISALPPPRPRYPKACHMCSQVPVCSLAIRQAGEVLSEDHPLHSIVGNMNHITEVQSTYIFRWITLLLGDFRNQVRRKGIGDIRSQPIWALPIEERVNRGSCLAELTVNQKGIWQGPRCLNTLHSSNVIRLDLFAKGQFVLISSSEQVAIAMGFITSISSDSISVLLERDLFSLSRGGRIEFSVDKYESNSSLSLTCSFLSLLAEDSDNASRLRSFIIDRKLPTFSMKLSKRIKTVGKDIFRCMNREQVRAVLQALAADSYIVIKGMPGTGKTRTLCCLIELLDLLGKSCLVTSHTHSSVDNILSRLSPGLAKRVIRLGRVKEDTIGWPIGDVSENTAVADVTDSKRIEEIYKSKSIVGATCLAAGTHGAILLRRFDYCIIDEASQVLQPEAVASLYRADKFVLIGDPEQLPPLVITKEARSLGMAESLLERLDRPAVTTYLKDQYRMNSVLTDLANKLTYDGMLKCANDGVANATVEFSKNEDKLFTENAQSDAWLKRVMSRSLSDSVIVIDVPASSDGTECSSAANRREAEIVCTIVRSFCRVVGLCSSDIGVMSPYRDQVALISSLLPNVLDSECVEVNTVDQYQGRDKSVVLYSLARSTPKAIESNDDILSDKRRLTVAVTRAKHKLIILGDCRVMESYPIFNRLLSFIGDENKCVYNR